MDLKKNSKKWLKINIFSYFLHYNLRYDNAESRPGGEHLLKVSAIFDISNISFQVLGTGKNCLKIVTLVNFLIFADIFTI